MKKAKLIIVKTGTVAHGPNHTGPFDVEAAEDLKPLIQAKFYEDLKGCAGYVLAEFNGKLFQCERNPIDPDKPYVRHVIAYHPLAKLFTSQKAS